MKVFLSKLAEDKLKKLTEYLLKEWSHKPNKDIRRS